MRKMAVQSDACLPAVKAKQTLKYSDLKTLVREVFM